MQTYFSVVWLIDVCHAWISHRTSEEVHQALAVNHISAFFPPTVELAREDYSRGEVGNKAAQKAAQGTQQRSPESVCLVNFRCGDTGGVKQGLTPPATLHTHTQRQTQPALAARHAGERLQEPANDPTYSIGGFWDCQGPSHVGTLLA